MQNLYHAQKPLLLLVVITATHVGVKIQPLAVRHLAIVLLKLRPLGPVVLRRADLVLVLLAILTGVE